MSAVVGEVDVVELDLVDTGRPTPAIGDFPGGPRRSLPTSVYLPASRPTAPLILLAHGFNGNRQKFTVLARRWAEAGYVVAVPQFPVTNDEFPEREPDATDIRLADFEQQVADVAFVVASVRTASAAGADGIGGRVDPDRLGLYGLSLGALTVWAALLRGGLGPNGAAAVVQSDGAFPGHIGDLTTVTTPAFIAHSDADPLFPIGPLLDEYAALAGPKCLLLLHGAAHGAVGENAITPADDAYHVATTTFWNRHLGGDSSADFPSSVRVAGVTTFVDGSIDDRLGPVGTRHQVR